MQLRLARLCLDCEEIHTEDRCPRCISEHFAMVSTWLPVEERRRFRRPAGPPPPRRSGLLGVVDTIGRWMQGGTVVDAPQWATRRSDMLARELDERANSAAPGPPGAIAARHPEGTVVK